MSDILNLSNGARIALALAVIAVIIVAVHIITSNEKLQKKRVILPLSCVFALILGFAGLYFLSSGSPDPRELKDFTPFAAGDLGAAADYLTGAVDLDRSDGDGAAHARLDHFDLVYSDGMYENGAYSAHFTDDDGVIRQHAVVMDGGKIISAGSRDKSNFGPEDGVPATDMGQALRELGSLDWANTVGLDPAEIDDISYSGDGAPTPGGWLLSGGELTEAGADQGGELPCLIVSAGGSSAQIYLDI